MAKPTAPQTARNKKEIFKITIWLPDQRALREVLAAGKVISDGGAPRRESDGTYRIELYASPAESKKIIALGYRSEVDKSYGEVLAMRRNEVSKIDRFQGGQVKPTGLGIKR